MQGDPRRERRHRRDGRRVRLRSGGSEEQLRRRVGASGRRSRTASCRPCPILNVRMHFQGLQPFAPIRPKLRGRASTRLPWSSRNIKSPFRCLYRAQTENGFQPDSRIVCPLCTSVAGPLILLGFRRVSKAKNHICSPISSPKIRGVFRGADVEINTERVSKWS